MNVKSFSELTWILMQHAPIAYKAFLDDNLISTTSWQNSDAFFYFSPKHISVKTRATYNDTALIYNLDWQIPGVPPPYADHYRNINPFNFDRPVVVINNKYITEWGQPPINYLSIELLDRIFECLYARYTIVYIRAEQDTAGYWNDEQRVHRFEDYDLILTKYPDIVAMNDLLKTTELSYNHVQLCLHSIADKFISVAGGNAVISSYFGGTNVIWSNPDSSRTCNRPIWSSGSHLSKLSGCEIIGVKSIDETMKNVMKWI